MARPKNETKAKEPVTLRIREGKSGNKSLYLDIYQNGVRRYEYLKMYLIPEKRGDEEAKLTNKNTLAAANAIKAQRVKELVNGKAGIKVKRDRILLLDWVDLKREEYVKNAEASGRKAGTAFGFGTLRTHLEKFISDFCKGPVYLSDIDKDFCLKFVDYLNTAKNLRIKADREEKPLANNTRKRLFAQFESIINKAVRAEVMEANPIERMDRADKPKTIMTERSFLTLEELRLLQGHPYGPEKVRQAFFFSCFTGLRWSDIKSLTWENIKKDGDSWAIAKRTIKTGEWVFNPLNDEAKSFLPSEADSVNVLVFDLPTASAANADLKRWAKVAGIEKKVSFHTARHTFATLMLTLGADLYTTSKLLGHTNIATTQIYAKIVDEKKAKAVSLMNGILNS